MGNREITERKRGPRKKKGRAASTITEEEKALLDNIPKDILFQHPYANSKVLHRIRIKPPEDNRE